MTTRFIDGEPHELNLIFEDTFDDISQWVNLTPATRWWTEDGKLHGHWAKGGSTLWCTQPLKGDLYLEFEATLLEPDGAWTNAQMPEGGKNVNLRFLVRGPEGVDILDAYRTLARARTGPNQVGDEKYEGYFFTWTHQHARLRRSPGYVNVSEERGMLPALGRKYSIAVLKTAGRLRYVVDNQKLHDYTDPAPHHEGRIGFTLWRSHVEIDRLRVYRIPP